MWGMLILRFPDFDPLVHRGFIDTKGVVRCAGRWMWGWAHRYARALHLPPPSLPSPGSTLRVVAGFDWQGYPATVIESAISAGCDFSLVVALTPEALRHHQENLAALRRLTGGVA